jgi:hypothetical protein
MGPQALFGIACAFRKAIEAVPPDARPVGMQRFPHGSCGDASLLLGAYLKDNQIEGFEFVCGERGVHEEGTWTSHAWLQHENCVIDITADQFSDSPSAIIVADPSPWHASFEAGAPEESDFRLWSGYGVQPLWPMYGAILRNLGGDRCVS